MKKIICPECGFSSEISGSGTCGICPECTELYMVDIALKLGELGEIKTRKIKDFRDAQKEAIKNENLNELGASSVNILSINQDDFISNYYYAFVKRKLGDDSLMITFLNEDTYIATEDQYEEVVNHVINNSEEREKDLVLEFLSNIDLPSKEFKIIKFLEIFESKYKVEEIEEEEEEEEVELTYEEKLQIDFDFCKEEANSNNTIAQRELAYHYLFGESTIINKELGNKYLSVAADNGDEEAMADIASEIIYSNNTEKVQKCMLLLEKLIKQDNPRGLFLAGKCYVEGIFVDIDYSIGIKYYMQSAEKNNPKALNNLANCFAYGTGVDEDIEKAIGLWERAVDGGSAVACFNLGIRYYNGDEVRGSYAKAFRYFKKGAELNHNDCCYYLYKCYDDGEGVKQSDNKAKEYFELALSLDSPKAWREKATTATSRSYRELFYVRDFYGELDKSGIEKAFVKAISLNPKNLDLKLKLSEFYYWNNYNLDQADVEVFIESLTHGNVNANFYLAECCRLGTGVRKNTSKANDYMKSFCGKYLDLKPVQTIIYNNSINLYNSKKEAKELLKNYSVY